MTKPDFPLYPHEYRSFLIHTGHIEDQRLTGVMFTHRYSDSEPHQTWQAAWEEMFGILRTTMQYALRLDLSLPLEEGELPINLGVCCEANLKDSSSKWCKQCGNKLEDIRSRGLPKNPEELTSSYRSLLVSYLSWTQDDMGSSDQYDEVWHPSDWVVGGGPEEGILTVIYARGQKYFGQYEELRADWRYWSKDNAFFKDIVFMPVGAEFGLGE